ncbi:hypothetical protein GCM10011519_19290 [Marmoricola endophyticus]|uniref:Mycothiol-dependent maleylpyruvate isomerase metal-binding domain-containing protein n=1 Tax=Marmoricola endophyticus TaxID=2040280 RepID=A0A917F2Y3_9ACTN|nr:maleylpyruvate isomerase N-terminal domain-containing protein [Marmoricola endophyticus]GGF45525.1 hypothetical protein GCM10011519_19290 [Marmoricola endophyticus]
MQDSGGDRGTDWGQLYRDHVAAVTELARRLTPEELSAFVPGTPEWSVRDVLAHLAGGPADTVSGRTEGAPGPEWTARHVVERRGRSVLDLTAELARNQEAVVASLLEDVKRAPVVYDIATHLADLHEALGLDRPAERYWQPVVDAIAQSRAAELVDRVAPYELFRAAFSRRSRTQLRAWGTGLADEVLDRIGVFGPRDDDQPTPKG